MALFILYVFKYLYLYKAFTECSGITVACDIFFSYIYNVLWAISFDGTSNEVYKSDPLSLSDGHMQYINKGHHYYLLLNSLQQMSVYINQYECLQIDLNTCFLILHSTHTTDIYIISRSSFRKNLKLILKHRKGNSWLS